MGGNLPRKVMLLPFKTNYFPEPYSHLNVAQKDPREFTTFRMINAALNTIEKYHFDIQGSHWFFFTDPDYEGSHYVRVGTLKSKYYAKCSNQLFESNYLERNQTLENSFNNQICPCSIEKIMNVRNSMPQRWD